MNDYSLFIMRCTQEAIVVAEKERFSRITPEYILILSKLRPAAVKCVEVPQESLRRLSHNDKSWIKDCLVVLTAEELKAKETEIISSLDDKIGELEAALREEKRKIDLAVGRNNLERNEEDV